MKIAIFTIKDDEVWEKLWEEVKKVRPSVVKYFCININTDEKTKTLTELSGTPGEFLKINNNSLSGFFFEKEEGTNKIKMAIIKQYGDLENEKIGDNTTAVRLVVKNYVGNDKIFIGEHSTGGKIRHDDECIKEANISTFQHGVKGDKIYELIKEFVHKFDFESFDRLCEIIKKKQIIPSFSLLKHRIAHLFLPMDIDLQGIQELYEYQSEAVKEKYETKRDAYDTTVKYLQKLLQEKKNQKDYYQKKLADLWFLVTKGSNFGIEANLNGNSLADGKAICDLIPNEKKESTKSEWQRLLTLCDNASIMAFMELMDKKIQNQNNVKIEDVKQILDFPVLSQTDNKYPSRNFHSWFCALDDVLEKLRKNIK